MYPVSRETASKTPVVDLLLDEQEKAVEALFNEIQGLELRLESVLTEPRPTNVSAVAKERETHGRLASKLIDFNVRVGLLVDKIKDIKARLEI